MGLPWRSKVHMLLSIDLALWLVVGHSGELSNQIKSKKLTIAPDHQSSGGGLLQQIKNKNTH